MNFIAFDTEDNSKELLANKRSGFEKKITQIAAIRSDGKTYHSKGDVIGFLKWLNSCKDFDTIYAHNLAYDLGNLFGNALDIPDVTLVGGRMIKALWRGNVFKDSFNLWPMSLAKVGKAFGLVKGELDPYSREYVFRDCEIVVAAIKFAWNLAHSFELQRLPSTLGSLCVAIWKQMGGENFFCDDILAKESYYGGRVELFAPSAKGRIVYTDINSLYPAAMVKEYPTAFGSLDNIEGIGLADVLLDIPDLFVAPLPVRRDDSSVYYPIGRVRGVWPTPEIQNALIHGCKLLKFYSAYGSKHGCTPFAEFVNHFYRARLESQSEAEKLFFKLLLNNLYGQLGMSGMITRSLKANVNEGTPYGSKWLCDTQCPLPEHCNYLQAAMVTSYSRVELYRHLALIPWRDLVYCDTDSVFFKCKGKLPFPTGDGLGEMKIVDESDCIETYAPKTYRFGNDYKAKGVKKANAREFIETGSTQFDLPYRFKEAAAYYDHGNSRQLSVWRTVQKQMRTKYDRKELRSGHWHPRVALEA